MGRPQLGPALAWWPGGSFSSCRCNQVHWHLLTRGLVLDPGKGRNRFEPISHARGPQRWVGSSVRTQLTGESQVLGSAGAGRRGGGVLGRSAKVPLPLLRAQNSDAAPGSVDPGMLTQCSFPVSGPDPGRGGRLVYRSRALEQLWRGDG